MVLSYGSPKKLTQYVKPSLRKEVCFCGFPDAHRTFAPTEMIGSTFKLSIYERHNLKTHQILNFLNLSSVYKLGLIVPIDN